jgi:hypothetical protein
LRNTVAKEEDMRKIHNIEIGKIEDLHKELMSSNLKNIEKMSDLRQMIEQCNQNQLMNLDKMIEIIDENNKENVEQFQALKIS